MKFETRLRYGVLQISYKLFGTDAVNAGLTISGGYIDGEVDKDTE